MSFILQRSYERDMWQVTGACESKMKQPYDLILLFKCARPNYYFHNKVFDYPGDYSLYTKMAKEELNNQPERNIHLQQQPCRHSPVTTIYTWSSSLAGTHH